MVVSGRQILHCMKSKVNQVRSSPVSRIYAACIGKAAIGFDPWIDPNTAIEMHNFG